MPAGLRVAAVDVGTNTVRLLVADVASGELRTVERGREITRLGQGLDASRHFAPQAVERTIGAIERFVAHARGAGSVRVRIAGTSAVRDATDRETFVALVRERTGIDMDVLSGEEEGRLSYLGATNGLGDGSYVVCDIGGGSTELSTSSRSVSLDVGSVRLTERYLRSVPPTDGEVEQARGSVRGALTGAEIDIPEEAKLVGVAGTITALTAVILGLTAYDTDRVHRALLQRGDVTATTRRLLTMTPEEIVALGPVEPGRADVIGGGATVLCVVMDELGFAEMLVSERDILDGLARDLSVA